MIHNDNGECMTTFKFVSEIAREVGCRPRDISDLFYGRHLPDDKCPVVAGRRLIPAELVPEIQRLLSEKKDRWKEARSC